MCERLKSNNKLTITRPGELEQLQAELSRVQNAKGTKEAAEELARFVKNNEGGDPLVTKTADNPYSSAPKSGGGGCC